MYSWISNSTSIITQVQYIQLHKFSILSLSSKLEKLDKIQFRLENRWIHLALHVAVDRRRGRVINPEGGGRDKKESGRRNRVACEDY